MDWDYWIRLRKVLSPVTIQTVFCAFRLHSDSIGQTNSFTKENLQERIYMLKKYYHGFQLYMYIVFMYFFNWPVYKIISWWHK